MGAQSENKTKYGEGPLEAVSKPQAVRVGAQSEGNGTGIGQGVGLFQNRKR